MTTIFARSPLQSLPMATNRPTTRRRSAKQAFEDDDAPAVQKRPRTEVNGTSKKATAAPKKTAKAAAYDEDDDGFQFSRRTSRRTTKAPPAPEPEPVPVEKVAKPAQPARRKKQSIAAVDPESSDSGKRRRSARISGDREQLEVRPKPKEPATAKPRTKKTVPVEKERQKKKQASPAPQAQPEEIAHAGVQTPTHNELQTAKKRDPNAQRIMLPFADTPVITRNKEMRKGNKDGHRRSSTGLRGRRASSLIDSGQSNGEFGQIAHATCACISECIGQRVWRGTYSNLCTALPHSEVEVREFYKYIEQSLPEPRRMKQLLTWCGSRALPAKPSGDVKNASAIMAGMWETGCKMEDGVANWIPARAIEQELIDDFAGKPELSDWFSRVRPSKSTMQRAPKINKCTGRDCAATSGKETESAKREEQSHIGRTRSTLR